jgi:hypothetical protein
MWYQMVTIVTTVTCFNYSAVLLLETIYGLWGGAEMAVIVKYIFF